MTVVTNTAVYRADQGIEYVWNGTFWVSHQMTMNWSALGVAASTDPLFIMPVVPGFSLYLDRLEISFMVVGGTPLDASNQWVIQLRAFPASGGASVVMATNIINSGSSDQYRFGGTNPTHAWAQGYVAGVINALKIGTPGALSLGLLLRYRIIGV